MRTTGFHKNFIIVLLIVFLISIITFESYQQLYYINRFKLQGNEIISVVTLFKNQLFSWIIWLGSTVFLWMLTRKKSVKTKFTSSDLLHYFGLITLLVVVVVSIIALIRMMQNGDGFTTFFADYFLFFMFQKGMVFSVGYIAISIILYQYLINKRLQIKVQELSELKKENTIAYNQLSNKIEDTSSVLNIKIGNKMKIIPIEDIRWIESDDYCVKIHTNDALSYSMRSTLKALEYKLKSNKFLRVHRNALVNMNLAKELDFSTTPKLILDDKTQIAVSKSKIKTVRNFLN